ncbi:aconitate hydratase [Gimesia benthica]|uniref:Aconitate hydratase n=1 Tax=Gimesia benthica TaxID=2608982 RepID=A0A6I6AHH9_9PLAN|nr:aconitate hydratase [Gimesia benthica]QGQ25546.1 aconitate hydratase [Gimesia benthica]
MAANLAQKLIRSHLVEGSMKPGEEIGLHIDQTLTQDATGTLVMLELEAMQLDRVQTEVSVQYVDHNLLQEDFKNPDDHLFLQSACQRFGLWFSRPGNGVSHPLHQEYFGKPGKTLLGSDSHTCSASALGMLAIGAGGLEVAMAMAGFPFYLKMPEIWGVHLTGTLPEWVSAKDVILEMLRRHDVKGAVNRIIEYHGPGLEQLSAMDRHVIANMGAELGATATVFPADTEIQHFLHEQGRADDYTEQTADANASYDIEDEIDLGALEPLIALPSSPGNVHTVREQAGPPIYQAYIGSSANPGYRDFAIAAEIVRGRRIHPRVSLDINPSSRQILMSLVEQSALGALIQSGARIHQAGCNGCIGMGQAPATDQISLRTVPRNFPGRSGTREDKVCLVSPETAAASALSGCITDPRTLEMPCPSIEIPQVRTSRDELFQAPPTDDNLTQFELRKGPNIKSIPEFEPLPDELEVPILLKMRDNISTDEILPAGARVLPYRSNIPEISRFAFEQIDSHYAEDAQDVREAGGHSIVAGENYGQGSSREHAALAPRYLGLRLVIAKSFARIHWQNLVNFGIIPLTFENPDDYAEIEQNVLLHMESLRHQVADQPTIQVHINGHNTITARHGLSERQREILLAGGLINWARSSRQKQA